MLVYPLYRKIIDIGLPMLVVHILSAVVGRAMFEMSPLPFNLLTGYMLGVGTVVFAFEYSNPARFVVGFMTLVYAYAYWNQLPPTGLAFGVLWLMTCTLPVWWIIRDVVDENLRRTVLVLERMEA